MSPLSPGGVQDCHTIRRGVDESVRRGVRGLVTLTVTEDVDGYNPETIREEVQISPLPPKGTPHRGTVYQQQGRP